MNARYDLLKVIICLCLTVFIYPAQETLSSGLNTTTFYSPIKKDPSLAISLQIPDPVIWLRSDSGTFQKAGKAASLPGDPVGYWTDISGNDHFAISFRDHLRPDLAGTSLNGYPSVHFKGDPDALYSSWKYSYREGTVVMVFRLNSQANVDNPNPHLLRLQPDSDAGTQRISWDWIKSQSKFRFGYRGTVPTYTTQHIEIADIQDNGQWHYATHAWSISENVVYARVDGREVGRLYNLAEWDLAPSEMVLGAKTKGGAAQADFDLVEVRIYSVKLSNDQIAQVEALMADTYDLASVEPTPVLSPTSTPTITLTPTITPSMTPTPLLTPPPTPTLTDSNDPLQTVLLPTDDVYVTSDKPDTNYGNNQKMPSGINPQRIVYIKFDLTSLAGANVTGASLRMYAEDGASSVHYVYRVMDTSWNQSQVTYNNRPASSANFFATISDVPSGVWFEVDITSEIASAVGGQFALAIHPGTERLWLHSRESSNKPTLLINY